MTGNMRLGLRRRQELSHPQRAGIARRLERDGGGKPEIRQRRARRAVLDRQSGIRLAKIKLGRRTSGSKDRDGANVALGDTTLFVAAEGAWPCTK